MLENVFDAIRNDFIAQSEGCATDTLDAFCAFAKEWVKRRCIVGVGQTTDGFAIRLADGNEVLLTQAAEMPEVPSAFAISGNAAGRGDRVKVDNASISITGR